MKMTCPLGHECEKMEDGNVIERCRWFKELPVKNIHTGESSVERDCTIVHQQKLLFDLVGHMAGNQAAVESFRNEMIKGENIVMKLIAAASQHKRIEDASG